MPVGAGPRSDCRDLTAWLATNGHRCTYFKLLHELAQLGYGGPERLAIKPVAAQVFPSRDIESVAIEPGTGHAEVVAWFGGLYGVDSPLPNYFDEVLAEDSTRAENLKLLLDLVGNRFYQLMFEIWKRVSPIHAEDEPLQNFIRKPLLSLCGLGHLRSSSFNAVSAVPYFTQGMQNHWGLRGVLSEYLQVPVAVREFEPGWVPLSDADRTRLASRTTAVLGRTFRSLGRRRTFAAHIRLVCGPLTLDQFLALLPGGDGYFLLAYLMHRYSPVDLEYRVELVLAAQETAQAGFKLGQPSTRLGATTIIRRAAGTPFELHIEREGPSLANDPEHMRAVVAQVEAGAATSRLGTREDAHGQEPPSVQSAQSARAM